MQIDTNYIELPCLFVYTIQSWPINLAMISVSHFANTQILLEVSGTSHAISDLTGLIYV